MYAKVEEHISQLSISTINDNEFKVSYKELPLKKHSVLIKIAGTFKCSLLFSYDDSLLDKLVISFLEGQSYHDDERDEIYESVATELVNIAAISPIKLPDIIDIKNTSFPMYINNPEDIELDKNCVYLYSEISTNCGNLLLKCIY